MGEGSSNSASNLRKAANVPIFGGGLREMEETYFYFVCLSPDPIVGLYSSLSLISTPLKSVLYLFNLILILYPLVLNCSDLILSL